MQQRIAAAGNTSHRDAALDHCDIRRGQHHPGDNTRRGSAWLARGILVCRSHDGAARRFVELLEKGCERTVLGSIYFGEQGLQPLWIRAGELGHRIDRCKRDAFLVRCEIDIHDVYQILFVLNGQGLAAVAIENEAALLAHDHVLNHTDLLDRIAHDALLLVAVDAPVQWMIFQ